MDKLEEVYNLIKLSKVSYLEIRDSFNLTNSELDEILDKLLKDNLIKINKNGYYKINKNNSPKNNINLDDEFVLSNLKESSKTIKELKNICGVSFDLMQNKLNELERNGLVLIRKERVFYKTTARFIRTKSNNSYCAIDGVKDLYRLDNHETSDLFDGDTINIVVLPKTSEFMNAKVLSVAERYNKFIIGEVLSKVKNGVKKYKIKSRILRFPVILPIDEEKLNGILDGEIVKASIKYSPRGVEIDSIVEVLGHKDDPNIEITEIVSEYGFDTEFSDEVKEELKYINNKVLDSELNGREDFRDKIIFTIDGDTSKDFDDAVSIDILDNGNYLLGVYIADVSHYVKENSALNTEALKRGTSLYLADKVIPMLPHQLSNGICSLNEGEDRLVLASLIEYDTKGKLINYDIKEGVIRSSHRMTYNIVNKILDGDKDLKNQYNDIYESLLNMHKLSKLLRDIRSRRGGLEFDTSEYEFVLDDSGAPIEIIKRERKESERLIEDFMLAANEVVAYHMNISHLPIVYRVHEEPDQEKLHETFSKLKEFKMNIRNIKTDIKPYDIKRVLEEAKESTNKDIISNLLLRSMMKAKYYEENLGHYGLQLKYYCHFTSPIRRYPDLMTHRMIKKLLLHPTNNFESDLKYYSKEIKEIALRNSNSEKRSIDLERDVDDMLYAWYMEKRVGNFYDGIITSIAPHGIYIEIENGIEGLFSFRDSNEYFTYNEEKMIAISSKKIYHIGDKIKVKCKCASRITRTIDFEIEE